MLSTLHGRRAVASSIAVRDYAASVARQPRDSMHYRTPAYTGGENRLPGMPPSALYLGFTSVHFDSDPLLYVFPGCRYFVGMMVPRRRSSQALARDRENAVKPVQAITR
jgi:hypothetical protein